MADERDALVAGAHEALRVAGQLERPVVERCAGDAGAGIGGDAGEDHARGVVGVREA